MHPTEFHRHCYIPKVKPLLKMFIEVFLGGRDLASGNMRFITVISVVLLEKLATEFNITLCVRVCLVFFSSVINVSLAVQYTSIIDFLFCIF